MAWQFYSQVYPGAEWVIVGPKEEKSQILESAAKEGVSASDIVYVSCPIGAQVGPKRNLSMEAATGEVFSVRDDDDWVHPDLLGWMAATYISRGPNIRGLLLKSDRLSVRLSDLRACWRPERFLWTGGIYNLEYARRFPFKRTPHGKGSDTLWVRQLRRRARRNRNWVRWVRRERQLLSLSHSKNVNNDPSRHLYDATFSDVESWLLDTAPEIAVESLRRIRELGGRTQ
jgi:glycosyltransferase involved in cell wall biosynthesis